MSDRKGYVDTAYLQKAADLLAPMKQRSYALMHIKSGQIVLDVGCGPGIDTISLAHLTGPQGTVVGVDNNFSMLAEADKLAKRAGVDGYLSYISSEAGSLPFESNFFDSSRSERLYVHLNEPRNALMEMVRVTKPGGWVVVVDTDWGTVSIDTPEVETERQLMRFRAEKLMHNGYSGRQLYRLFKQCNLVDILIEMLPIYITDYALDRFIERLDVVEEKAVGAGIITEAAVQRWQKSLEEADKAGCFFGSASLIMVVGRKT